MKILIIKNDGLGDLVLTSGLISYITRKAEQVDLLTCSQNKEIAEMIPGLNKVFYISRDNLNLRKSFDEMDFCDKQTILDLMDINYDLLIVLRRYIRQSTFKIASYVKAEKKYMCWNVPTNLSYSEAEKLSVGNYVFQASSIIFSELEYFKCFVEEIFNIKIDIKDVLPKLSMDVENVEVDSNKIGLIIGGSSCRWDLRNWGELIEYFLKENKDIVLFGGDDALKDSEWLKDKYPTIENEVGKLGFKESIQELKSLQMIIGNDTGFMHFASLYTKKCMVILGGGTFRHFFPWPSTFNQYVIYYGMSCYDCNWVCRLNERQCLIEIKAENVIDYYKLIISGNKVYEMNLNSKSDLMSYRVDWRYGQSNITSSFSE